MQRFPRALAALAVLFGSASILQAAPLTLNDFEAPGFVPGESVHNHRPDGTNPMPPISSSNLSPQAWLVRTAGTDEGIVGFGGSHGNVWRLSQGTNTGSLGNAPQSPHMGMVAGETGALNDAGRGPVTTSIFYGQFDFRSATGGAQPGLQINVTGASYDQRHGYVRIIDDGGGFDLGFFDTVGNMFNFTPFDLDLPYDEWHTVGIEVLFNDGFASGTFGDQNAEGNDVVNIYVNGVLVHTGTSWESYYAAFQNHAESIDTLQFSGSGVISAQLGGGLYFDNIIVTNESPQVAPVPEPASFALWTLLGIGGVGGGLRRWRNRPRTA